LSSFSTISCEKDDLQHDVGGKGEMVEGRVSTLVEATPAGQAAEGAIAKLGAREAFTASSATTRCRGSAASSQRPAFVEPSMRCGSLNAIGGRERERDQWQSDGSNS
jgi:hypothetical protein